MKVLFNWLKEFVELKATPADLRARLSTSGTAVAAIEESVAGPMLDAELTANRPDCLGHYGIAREGATLYRLALKPVQPKFAESATPVSQATSVAIETPELCSRFTAPGGGGGEVRPLPG